MVFRSQLGTQGWIGDTDVVEEVGEAIMQHALRFPEEFVMEDT